MTDAPEKQDAPERPEAMAGPQRAGFAAVVGAPNAGKSTLVNRLVGTKVSIVTPKAQTTRSPLRGIVMRGSAQIVLVDTPGVFAPRRRLDRAMVEAAWQGAGEADVIVLVVDASRQARAGQVALTEDEMLAPLIDGLSPARQPVFLALNKVDTMAPPALLGLARAFSALRTFEAVFMISALTGDGVEDLAAALARAMPEGPWLYPADQAADVPLRLLAAEVTREKLYLKLHDELPYASGVETERYEERRDGSVRIEQVVFVEREGQKAIVLGRGGQTVKAIGEAARRDLEAALGRRVHLFLHVKVKAGWSDRAEHFRTMGLSVPKD